jgi:regulator of sigma E protease
LRLIQNRVSAKSIGGPIMIGQLASKTFEIGLSPFLKIMAIISINLFILNLMPIPVLDGGHLVFFTVEALRGAPLSMRKMEIAQQVGLVLLMSLMFLALFNDVSRLFQ